MKLQPSDLSSPQVASAAQAASEAEQQTIRTCGQRPTGHRWRLIGEPDEPPYVSCEDCPAGNDAVMFDLLDGAEVELGGRTIHLGDALTTDAEPYEIPVDIECTPWQAWTDYGYEYDVDIEITDREGATGG